MSVCVEQLKWVQAMMPTPRIEHHGKAIGRYGQACGWVGQLQVTFMLVVTSTHLQSDIFLVQTLSDCKLLCTLTVEAALQGPLLITLRMQAIGGTGAARQWQAHDVLQCYTLPRVGSLQCIGWEDQVSLVVSC